MVGTFGDGLGDEFAMFPDEDLDDSPALVSFTIRVPWLRLADLDFPNSVSASDVVHELQSTLHDPAHVVTDMDLLDGAILEVKVARQVETGRVGDEIVYNAVISHASWDPSIDDDGTSPPSPGASS